MKKLLSPFLFVAIILSSCGTLPKPQSNVGTIDYTPLIKEGIYITESNSVNFDYTAVGSVIATEKGGWVNETVKRPYVEDAFKNIIKELKRIGANGIINLSITSSVELSEDILSKAYVSVITVKGMAIKIPNSNIKKVPKEDKNTLGEVDGIKCKIIEKHNNGIRISTPAELTIEQIKKVQEKFQLKGKIMFNIEGNNAINEAYAGIDAGYIILYKTNEFIKL